MIREPCPYCNNSQKINEDSFLYSIGRMPEEGDYMQCPICEGCVKIVADGLLPVSAEEAINWTNKFQ